MYALELTSGDWFVLRVNVCSRSLCRCYKKSHDYHSDKWSFPSSFSCRCGASPFFGCVVPIVLSVLVFVFVLFLPIALALTEVRALTLAYICTLNLSLFLVLVLPTALALAEARALTLAWFRVLDLSSFFALYLPLALALTEVRALTLA